MARKPFIRVKLQGFKRIGEAVKELDKKHAKKVIKKGVLKGVQVYAKALKPAAPKETGQLRRSIGHKVKVYRGGFKVFGIVGPRTGFGKQVSVKIKNKKGRTVGKRQEYRDPNKYAHILEARRPWMKPVFVSRANEVERAAMDAMRAELNTALREMAQKARTAG